MRHLVNFGLLFCFLTLAVTGVMQFVLPFSIVTARVHIILGLATLVLVGLHLAGRLGYFKRQLGGGGREGARISPPVMFAIVVGWAVLLGAAFKGWRPAELVVEQGYEARHRAEIVRTSPLAGFQDPGRHERIVARSVAREGSVPLALYVGFGRHVEKAPSIAVWAETPSGAMIETLFLDESLAYSNAPEWGGAPTPRHQILPIWRHRHTMVSGVDPLGEVDAFTAATPEHSFTLDDYLVVGEGKSFILCVEVNAPRDPNDRYPDPRIGQPSLLYTAFIEPGSESFYALLELTGHGGGAEKSGAIQYGLGGFTTAKNLVDLLLVRVGAVNSKN